MTSSCLIDLVQFVRNLSLTPALDCLVGNQHSFTPREAVVPGRFWQCFCRNIPTTEQRENILWVFPAWACTRLAQCSNMGAAWDYFSFSCFFYLFPRVFHAYLHVFACSHLSSKGALAACCVVFRTVFRDFLWCPFWWRTGKLPVQIPPSEMWSERVRALHLSSSEILPTSHLLGWNPPPHSSDISWSSFSWLEEQPEKGIEISEVKSALRWDRGAKETQTAPGLPACG